MTGGGLVPVSADPATTCLMSMHANQAGHVSACQPQCIKIKLRGKLGLEVLASEFEHRAHRVVHLLHLLGRRGAELLGELPLQRPICLQREGPSVIAE